MKCRFPEKTALFTRHFGCFTAVLLLLLPACKKQPEAAPLPPSQSPVTEKLMTPGTGAYIGAYMDFGENQDEVTDEAIDGFEKLVAKHQAIVAFSNYWGEQDDAFQAETFPTDSANLIQKRGSVPLIYWCPWDDPYDEGSGPDRFSLENILAGKWNDYIDAWAAAAKQFGHPLFVSFAKEPNGSGFPWSGMYCGGDEKVAASGTDTGSGTFTGAIGKQGKLDLTLSVSSLSPTGGQYEGPETYKKAYRYVVDRVRAKGASNVIWVFQVMNFSIPQDDWNYIAQYYPGAGYVDWLALTISGAQYPDDAWSPFSPLLKEPYAEICKLDPSKPVMIAEWRCGEFPKSGSKADFIAEAFSTMKNYPRLKAAIYWDETWQNEDDSKSDLRVDSSPEALDAYKKGVADPFWIDHPIYRQTAK